MKKQILEKLAALSAAAFGLVAALAWNDAIKSLFAVYYEVGEGIIPKIIYAVVVTVMAVVVTIQIGKFSEKKE